MPLRAILEATPETIRDFDIAAEQRYWEGLALLTDGYAASGIYLLGYVAEMLLKTACFRFDGALPSQPVTPLLLQARTYGKANLSGISFENYHSLNPVRRSAC